MCGKFVIYSGGSRTLNKKLDQALIALCGHGKRITYIPVTDDQDPKYFNQFKKYYKNYGFKKFCYFALDKKNSKSLWKEAFSANVIYLDGGNTYHFLKNMQNSCIKQYLKDFLKRGGIIAGQSAGIISLTPSINTAAIPSLDADELLPGFNKRRGLNLISFEFSPHFSVTDNKSKKELKLYSSFCQNEIIACDDGSGIIINGNQVQFIGSIYSFKNGIFKKKN